MLKKTAEELEEIRQGKKRRGKSTCSSAAAREMYACAKIYVQKKPKERAEVARQLECDDMQQVVARLEVLRHVAVFERLHRPANAGVLQEITEIFDEFEREAAAWAKQEQ